MSEAAARQPIYFRLRVIVILLIYVLGFWAPWTHWTGPESLTWLAAPALLARSGVIGLAKATVFVTITAIVCAWAGAWLRLWGTAYLGSSVVQGVALRGEGIVASGPFRHTRNPLYLGAWIFSLGVAILMPPSGAVFFLAAQLLFYGLLIRSEEAFLRSIDRSGAYAAYVAKAPRLWPSLRARVEPVAGRPRWLQALAAEVFVVGFALCLAVLAWQYNAQILERALIILFGVSLMLRALQPRALKP